MIYQAVPKPPAGDPPVAPLKEPPVAVPHGPGWTAVGPADRGAGGDPTNDAPMLSQRTPKAGTEGFAHGAAHGDQVAGSAQPPPPRKAPPANVGLIGLGVQHNV